MIRPSPGSDASAHGTAIPSLAARTTSSAPARPVRHAAAAILALITLLLSAGCVTETEPEKPVPMYNKPASRDAKPVQLTGMDECSANMHDLSSYLLEYYAVNHRLPQTLEELRPMVDGDKELPLKCPVSGKAYAYHPELLVAEGDPKRLVLNDPEPSHGGKRWAIMSVPREGKTPLGLWVVLLNEGAFQQFHTP